MAYPSENRPSPGPDALPPLPDGAASPTESALPLPDELARTLAGLGPAGEAPAARGRATAGARTRALRLAIWSAAAMLLLLVLFIAQNTGGAQVGFLWMQGRMPLALALVVAGAAGAAIATAVFTARIVHLRGAARSRRR
ncbi:lipopolysaccharide assembly protein LapA domain-containing protein [Actinoplanes sp. NPDC051475]|uniref:lipopolysaccharide assembly protein LapA domain-containing protein n=1 Tax=Actinoplanes sp. NPDC051475 TaxID=3157225 RepID=UPI00344E5810